MSLPAAGGIALPLDKARIDRLDTALAGLSSAQLTWASGYVLGLAARDGASATSTHANPDELTILYGSQTGNGERVARGLEERVKAAGFCVRCESLADYQASAIKRERFVALIVSTHGEGEPPDDAELLHEFLLGSKAPRLDGLRFTVFALGDSSYVNFCQTGREFDARLAELGAQRLLPLVECDLAFTAESDAWSAAILEKLPELIAVDDAAADGAAPRLWAVAPRARYDRARPFPAAVLTNQKISGRDSGKDVRHIELSLEDSGLDYEPGDALAVIADNPPRLVAALIAELGADPLETIRLGDEVLTLDAALSSRLEITAASTSFLKAWADRAANPELNRLLAPGQEGALTGFLHEHQIIDVVRRFPAAVGAQDFAACLRALGPRSYSIASSLRAHPGELHLTVAVLRYRAFGSEHEGAASTYLADRVAVGERVRVYVEANERFRLPADDTAPVIMIGPGTGVAPFRAFIEERRERAASGDNWLFFGDRCLTEDFLYQLEWQRYLKSGLLTRLDVAFSRDQARKIYVQDRLRERSAEVFAWLEKGAYVYVCGDARRMAGDVHAALLDILSSQGGLTPEAAEQRLKALKRAGRYRRDVY